MSLIIETGSIVANANSYASLATVTAYHLDRNNTAWAAEAHDEVQEAAILRAMDYIEAQNWLGMAYMGPVGGVGYQPLQWPRVDVVVGGYELRCDEVPPKVISALCEAALVELVTPGALSVALERGGAVIREKVDVIETEYASGAPATTVYQTIRQHLRGLVAGGNSIQLVRV
jgi:hypothetical protein